MKISKSFLKIFSGLAMVFVFSFNVFAKNRHEEKVGQKFEDFAIKIGLHTEEKRGLPSGKSILKSYIEKGLKLKGGLREEKFKKTKEELLVFCRKRIEGARLTLKKQQDLLKKIETNLNEENFKNIIKFGIEEFKKDVSFLNKCLKTKGISEEEKDSLNQGIDLKKKCLEYLNKLNNKNKLCDADRKGLKRNLKLGIDEAKNDLKESKKIKEEIESLEYKEFKKYISKGETKNKDLEKFIKNFSIKNKGSKEKLVSDMVLQYIFEKNNLKKGFKITKNMFEEAKKEFIEFYKKIIEEKEGLAKKGEEAFKKGEKAIITFVIKNNKEVVENIKNRIENEKLTEKELNIAESNLKFLEEANKNLKNGKLDKKQKVELENNWTMVLDDLKESKKIKEEIESLEYKEFRKYISKGETKNKDLEKFIKNFNVKNKGGKEKVVSDMVLQYILEKNNLKKGFKITKNMFEEAKKEFIELYKKIIEEKEGLAKKGEEAFKKGFMAVINVKIKEDEKEMELVEETSKEKGLKKWQEDDLKKAKQRLMGSLSWLKKIKNKEIEIDENEKIKIKDDLRSKIIQSTIVAQSIKDIKKEFERLKYEEVKNLAD